MENTKTIPSAWRIFDQSLKIYKARFGDFLALAIVTLLPLELSRTFVNSMDPRLYFALVVLSLVLLFAGQLGMYYLAADSGLRPMEAVSKGLHRFFPFIGTALLTGLSIVAGYILIIPGIILSVWFAIASPVFAFEKVSGVEAMVRSRNYVSSRFGAVFWRLFVIGFFAGVLSGIADGIQKHINAAAGNALSIVIGILILPLTTIYVVELYAHLRAIHGGEHPRRKGLRAWIWILAVIGILMPIALIMFLIKYYPQG